MAQLGPPQMAHLGQRRRPCFVFVREGGWKLWAINYCTMYGDSTALYLAMSAQMAVCSPPSHSGQP